MKKDPDILEKERKNKEIENISKFRKLLISNGFKLILYEIIQNLL
jgi:hypothetical protein